MGLTIELSFNINKNRNITEIKENLSNLAEKYNSYNNYFLHEIEGYNTTIERNECVNIIEFNNKSKIDEINIIKFIKNILELHNISIDCIYDDNKKQLHLIYMSKKYIQQNKEYSIVAINKPIFKSNQIIELVINSFK